MIPRGQPALERESGIGLHGAAGLRSLRNLAYAWICDPRGQSRRAQLVIRKPETGVVYEICGIHTNLKASRLPLGKIEGLA